MIAHSLDELITAVTELSARVAAIDGHAPVLSHPEAAPFVDRDDSLRDEMTGALAAVMAKLNEIEIKPASTAVAIDLNPFEVRLIAIEQAVMELRSARAITPLVPVSVPDYDARITALEHHASTHTELSDALALCLQMARESEARTARLEQEARDMHGTISTVVPMLQVAMAR